jgi:hypothetical protein
MSQRREPGHAASNALDAHCPDRNESGSGWGRGVREGGDRGSQFVGPRDHLDKPPTEEPVKIPAVLRPRN